MYTTVYNGHHTVQCIPQLIMYATVFNVLHRLRACNFTVWNFFFAFLYLENLYTYEKTLMKLCVTSARATLHPTYMYSLLGWLINFRCLLFMVLIISVYPNLPEEGCQESFLSLLRERALCALYLYRSLDSKDNSLLFSLHNWVESVTNPEQDKVIKMNTEAIQKLKTLGMKYMLIQVLRGNRAFNRL